MRHRKMLRGGGVQKERCAVTREQMLAHIRDANAVAREAAAHGHHPFGAVLVGPDGVVLMRQGNVTQ